MAASQKFCLKWNNFQNSVTSVFDSLRQDEELVDITLCCEGRKIKAHRMMLSACSPYFRDLFKDNPCQHPLFFLKDTSYVDIAAVIEFVYKGEVNVLQSQLASFLKTAELLQVKGLSGDEEEDQAPRSQPPDRSRLPSGPPPPPPPVRQRPRESAEPPASPRLKRRRLSGSSGSRPGSPSAVSAAPPPPAAAAGPRDPAADVMAGPPGAALPPPPPPPVSGADLAEPPPPQHEPPPPPQPAAGRQDYGIKVEKIDIADDDDDVSLEATLGQVSTFEASQFDGSDHSASSHDMSGLLSGLSDRVGDVLAPSASAEDGSAQGVAYLSDAPAAAPYSAYRRAVSTGHVGARPGSPSGFFVCTEPGCGMRLRSQPRLSEHRSWHRGETTCHVCGRRFSSKHSMWKHAAHKHGSLMPPTAATRRFGAGVGVITGVQGGCGGPFRPDSEAGDAVPSSVSEPPPSE
ncbi:protein bric-a-brac 2-like isoform X2 [Amphibalanus amphitrite]|nr:protein bric-a-brac 2-like isoform X2 [Amphibalanus amphitrite]XP_043218469.1 protein bric-a-brac 2-like isoform X2 [Amphibalanus amphitrite]XP_043218470.1 protein bric-a-brac 2-like isoform X2 [Amphibalanus amphitrite]